jgi:dihydrofolate reductase
MRKFITSTWVTLDGFIASLHEEMGKYEDDMVSAAGTLLLGRVMYQSFAGSWQTVL